MNVSQFDSVVVEMCLISLNGGIGVEWDAPRELLPEPAFDRSTEVIGAIAPAGPPEEGLEACWANAWRAKPWKA